MKNWLSRAPKLVEKKLQNVELPNGPCVLCKGPIDPKWSHGGLGAVCKKCFDRRDEIFGPENVDIRVEKQIIFQPLFGWYSYQFDWAGTRVMINGRVGVVTQTYLGSCCVQFPDGKKYGDSIKNLDYWRLLAIYKESGGEVTPPPLDLPKHALEKQKLLDTPILKLEVSKKDGQIRSIQIKDYESARQIPYLRELLAFVNIYVRYKFGLAENHAFEGGFIGLDFEVRNMMGGYGITIRGGALEELRHIATPEGIWNCAVKWGLIGSTLKHEATRPEVVKDASLDQVLATWSAILMMLLCYDWCQEEDSTIEGRWSCHGAMQRVLLNTLPEAELREVLDYAIAKNKRRA